ncbi:MAG TPA: CHAD domain-containing protein, partial [Ideonella sp.]|nr:CHAD domain-containing protein [Ideonella sp.]
GWEAPLAAAFAELGEVRDRETVTGAVAAQLNAAGAPVIVLPPPAKVPADPVATVRSAAFQGVLLDLLGFTLAAGEDDGAAEGASPKPRKAVSAKLARLHRQVARDGARFDALEEAAQHRVRKRLKRLRYLAEVVGGLFEARAVKHYLAQLRPAQDALGEHNDAWVALAMYRDAAQQGHAEAWFAVGWLQARLPMTVKVCGKALAKVSDASRFW